MKGFLAAAAVFVGADLTAAQDIGGRYLVAGANLNGSPYCSGAEITLTSN